MSATKREDQDLLLEEKDPGKESVSKSRVRTDVEAKVERYSSKVWIQLEYLLEEIHFNLICY